MISSKKLIKNLAGTFLCIVLSAGMGIAFLFWTQPVYEAETRLYIQNNQVADRPANLQVRQFVATQAEVIRSPLIVRQALEIAPVTLPANFDGDEIKFVMDKLSVAPVLDTDIVSISYRSNSSEEAVALVQAVVQSFQQQLKKSESISNSGTLELLTDREEELRNKLAVLNQSHLDLRNKNNLVGQSRDAVNVYSAMLSDLAQKLTDVRLEKIELSSRLESLALDKSGTGMVTTVFKPALDGSSETNTTIGSDSQVKPVVSTASDKALADLWRDQDGLGAKHIAELENQIVLATIRLQHLNNKFGEKHVESRQAAAELDNLEQMMREQLQANSESLQLQYKRAVKAEADLKKLYQEEQKTVKELDTYLVQDEKIRSEVERTELIYKTILERLGEIILTDQALENGQSSVVVQDLKGAKIVADKIWPQPKSFLAICLMVGGCGGFLLTFGMDALRTQSKISLSSSST